MKSFLKSLAGTMAAFLVIVCTIVIQPPLVTLVLLPRDIAGMCVLDRDQPCLTLHLAQAPTDREMRIGQCFGAVLAAAVDVGPCVERIV